MIVLEGFILMITSQSVAFLWRVMAIFSPLNHFIFGWKPVDKCHSNSIAGRGKRLIVNTKKAKIINHPFNRKIISSKALIFASASANFWRSFSTNSGLALATNRSLESLASVAFLKPN